MGCILQDIAPQIASFVGDSGVCADNEAGMNKLISELNIAIPSVMKRLDAKGTLAWWCFRIYNGCFWLPEDCLEPRQIWLDGRAMEQRDEWFEGKLGHGLERTSQWRQPHIISCGYQQLMDLGDGFAIPNPWPTCPHTKLALIAESEADKGKIVQVRFLNEYNEEIEEFLELQGDRVPVVTQQHVTDIKFLRKPVTDGGVSAYVNYDSTRLRQGFCRYNPWTTTASFRRKKIPGAFRNGCCGTILIKGKMRFRRILKPTDPLQICDLQGLGFALMAVAAMRKRDPEEYNNNMLLAVNELNKELSDETSPAATGQIQFKSPFGRGAFSKPYIG